MEVAILTKPASNKVLLKQSVLLYRASFKKIIGLALIFSLIVFIPRLISDAAGQDIFAFLPPLSIYRLWLIVINIAALLFFIAILWRMHCVMVHKHEPLIEDFQRGFKKIISVFIAAVLESIIFFALIAAIYGLNIFLYQHDLLFGRSILNFIFTAIIFIGQFILLLYFSLLFLFFIPIIAIENNGIFYSLEKSIVLVWNHWWRAFSLQMIPWLCYLFGLLAIKAIFGIDIHVFFLPEYQHSLWITVLNGLIFAIFIPWVAAILLVQIKDLELRKKLFNPHARKK